MTAINVNLHILRNLLPKDVSEDVISRLADMEILVTESVRRMRSTMTELRPPMLDRVKIDDRYMKDTRLPSEIEIALFRIAQEALNNVAKHARASQVDIELFEDDSGIMMAITDNGVGFDKKSQRSPNEPHWGLPLMQERVRAINGKFLLRSVPGQGTQIVVRVKNEK